MNREQLLDVANRLIAWINATQFDPEALATIAAKNVVVPIPYPGSTPDYAGVLAIIKKTHEAASEYKLELKDSIVDEKESKVVVLVQCTGIQTGYSLIKDN
jgi:hypothetical protein